MSLAARGVSDASGMPHNAALFKAIEAGDIGVPTRTNHSYVVDVLNIFLQSAIEYLNF